MSLLSLAAVGVTAFLHLQDQTAAPAPQDAVTQLEDVTVEARRLEEAVRTFVDQVAVPARGRGLARWQGSICVGVVNLDPSIARSIVDRISQVGMDLGLETGEPGCRANIIIIFASDGSGLAASLIEEHRRAFRAGIGSMDRGNVALREFQSSDRAVRWWQISIPVNAETGLRAVRLSGDYNQQTLAPEAPRTSTFAASRLTTQIRDDLTKAMVIVDVERLGAVNLAQLADYLALVSLAQIDPEADTAGYDTVLNLFTDRQPAAGLTDWDRAYLSTLYDVLDDPQRQINAGAQARTVAGAMTNERRRAQSEGQPDRE